MRRRGCDRRIPCGASLRRYRKLGPGLRRDDGRVCARTSHLYYLFVSFNSMRRFFCMFALSVFGANGYMSPNPDGTRRFRATPSRTSSFTTAVARNNESSMLFEYARLPGTTGLLSVWPSTRIIHSISDGIYVSISLMTLDMILSCFLPASYNLYEPVLNKMSLCTMNRSPSAVTDSVLPSAIFTAR